MLLLQAGIWRSVFAARLDEALALADEGMVLAGRMDDGFRLAEMARLAAWPVADMGSQARRSGDGSQALEAQRRMSELLAAVPPFDRCGQPELAEVARRTSIVDEPVGAVLMRQGESGSEMAINIEGRVAIVRNETVIAERGPGEVLGEMALLSGMPRTATVIVLVATRLLLISRPDFDVLMAELPSFRSQVLESLARRARDL